MNPCAPNPFEGSPHIGLSVSNGASRARRTAFMEGLWAIAPILLGLFPFAIITGVTVVGVGIEPIQAMAMSVLIFAGAAQLAAADLIGKDAPFLIVVLTALVINLRFLMYSAPIAPHFRHLGNNWKWPIGYLLTDQAYAVSILKYDRKKTFRHKEWFYLGAASALWLVWQAGTVVGVILGLKIPSSWSLEFAVPLTFMALLFPHLKDFPAMAAAIASGIVAMLAYQLPLNTGLIAAAVVGILVGFFLEQLQEGKKEVVHVS